MVQVWKFLFCSPLVVKVKTGMVLKSPNVLFVSFIVKMLLTKFLYVEAVLS